MRISFSLASLVALGAGVLTSLPAQSDLPTYPQPPGMPAIPVTSDATPPAARSPGPIAPSRWRFSDMDADGNGMVSLVEFTVYLSRSSADAQAAAEERARTGVNPHELLFRQVDRNHDSLLSEAELGAHLDEQK